MFVVGILRVGNAAFTAPKLALEPHEGLLSKDRDLARQSALQKSLSDPEKVYFRETVAFTERALLITIGATVTVLAGFLSQVWGSGGIPFRTELAKSLVSFGWLLSSCFGLPFLRIFSLRPALYSSWWSIPFFAAWAVGSLCAAIYYLRLLLHLGEIIMRHAVVATP